MKDTLLTSSYFQYWKFLAEANHSVKPSNVSTAAAYI